MKHTSILKTCIMALCAAMLCGSCIVQEDRPRRPRHHKKAKPHKKPKPPRRHGPHHVYLETGNDGNTYYAWNVE